MFGRSVCASIWLGVVRVGDVDGITWLLARLLGLQCVQRGYTYVDIKSSHLKWEAQVIASTGGYHLREIRPYWVKILSHQHVVTCRDLAHVLDVLNRSKVTFQKKIWYLPSRNICLLYYQGYDNATTTYHPISTLSSAKLSLTIG